MYSWEQFIKYLANCDMQYSHLRTIILAQAGLECGWGTSKLFSQHGNPFGMHYHDFMASFSTPVVYDASDGKGTYASFATPDAAITAYFTWFRHWGHYAGWESAAKESGEAFIRFIAPHYCPPGMKDSWASRHAGLTYPEYIIVACQKVAKNLIDSHSSRPLPSTVKGFRVYNLSPEVGVEAFDQTGRTIGIYRGLTVDSLVHFFSNFPHANHIEFAEPGKKWPGVSDSTPKPKKVWRVYLDPGHSDSRSGAHGKNPKIREYDLNKLAMKTIENMLIAAGHEAHTYDPDPDNLTEVGKRSQGYDMAISGHHNATDGEEHYVSFWCSKTPKAKSLRLGKAICDSISKELKLKSIGTRASGLTIPNLFEQFCTGPSGLIEFYFIDAYADLEVAKDRTIRAAKAAGEAILNFIAEENNG